MAPDLDDICAEQLAHLGPVALETVRLLINRSWENGQVPSSWRSAIIIPIPKASKNPKATESYCPISLTSHLAKLAERLVAARLTVLADQTGLPPPPPPQQVGFRRGRAVEENLARLIQMVQDGWNLPKPRGRPEDGKTADKFVLLAFDFSRAYDTIGHNMLISKLLHQLPRCMTTWMFNFLRDRRACAEVNGVRSSERPLSSGFSQKSVLAPTLFILWSADLLVELRRVPRTSVYAYADDTGIPGNTEIDKGSPHLNLLGLQFDRLQCCARKCCA